jgi:site-specific DNA-methyltransferase (adenine-specific)
MTTKPYTIHNGNSLEVLKGFEENSIDSIVCDPPYELGFMNKKWDSSGIAYNVDLWKECLRVLKPGGHLLAFSGSRTYHRMTVAIEDAGFEIRDQIMWVYGSGFPKSHDVSKAIDKMKGAERIVVEKIVKKGGDIRGENGYRKGSDRPNIELEITIPSTEAAKEWDGWGTALKPAHEPICLARKPLIGTVAENVLEWGTGGINIKDCKVGFESDEDFNETTQKNRHQDFNSNDGIRVKTKGIYSGDNRPPINYEPTEGRFPANLIHDGSDEVINLFPTTKSEGHWPETKVTGFGNFGGGKNDYFGVGKKSNDKGLSTSRFFYCAKASKKDRDEGLEEFEERTAGSLNFRNPSASGRNENAPSVESMGGLTQKRHNHHPTVKPTSLMQYLCRLVTPPNGIVLDPFMGSGSTGKAAVKENFNFVGIDLDPEYCKLAEARIQYALVGTDEIKVKDSKKETTTNNTQNNKKVNSLW